MERMTGGRVDRTGADNLIAKMYPRPDSFLVDLKTAGAYARGTVLSLESDGSYAVLGAGSGKASAVIANSTLEDDSTAVAYRSGHFNRNALTVKDGYELTAADENDLRNAGIFLSDSLGVRDAEAEDAPDDATLSALTIGSLTLTPAFSKEQTSYTASTTAAKNKITATATDSNATVTIKNGDSDVESGSDATWETGENTITVTVKNGTASTTYTVTVTKS